MKRTVLLYYHPIIAMNEGYSKVIINDKEYKFVASRVVDFENQDHTETLLKVKKGKYTLSFLPTNIVEIDEETQILNGIKFTFLKWKPEHIPSDNFFFTIPFIPVLIPVKKSLIVKILKRIKKNDTRFQFK